MDAKPGRPLAVYRKTTKNFKNKIWRTRYAVLFMIAEWVRREENAIRSKKEELTITAPVNSFISGQKYTIARGHVIPSNEERT